MPYFGEQIVAFLEGLEHLVLVGAKAPVSFFAYPGKPGSCTPAGCEVVYLAHADEDSARAAIDLADAVGAPVRAARAALDLPGLPTGALDVAAVVRILAHLTPDNAIVVDEALTASQPLQAAFSHARPHDHLALTGGAIGEGLPLAVGAAVAAPDRKIVCAQADGSGAYTMQALWTMAREKLDATVVVFANRSYAILNIEAKRVGATLSAKGRALLDLHNPELSWTADRRGHGRRSQPRCDRGRLRGAIPLGDGRPRPAPYRSVDLRSAAALPLPTVANLPEKIYPLGADDMASGARRTHEFGQHRPERFAEKTAPVVRRHRRLRLRRRRQRHLFLRPLVRRRSVPSSLPGFIIATIANFALNRAFTFAHSTEPLLAAFVRYVMVCAVGLAVNYAAYAAGLAAYEFAGHAVTPAVLPVFVAFGSGIAMFFTYFGFRLFAFRV